VTWEISRCLKRGMKVDLVTSTREEGPPFASTGGFGKWRGYQSSRRNMGHASLPRSFWEPVERPLGKVKVKGPRPPTHRGPALLRSTRAPQYTSDYRVSDEATNGRIRHGY
jgi:hypothetical protein